MKHLLKMMGIIIVLFGLVFILQGADKKVTATIFVAPNGSDSGDGSIKKPYATVEKALSIATAGDTIYLRGGIYSKSIEIKKSGNKQDGYIKIQNYKNEKPIIDLTNEIDDKEMIGIYMKDQSYIIIDGLTVRNIISSKNTTYGIRIMGKGSNIKIRNCEIYNIEGYGKAMAHPILAAGSDYNEALRIITINNNHIHDCSTNNSEQLTIAGNAEEIYILNNTVEDCSNIGICIIGNYSTTKNASLNQPRQVVVKANKVRRCIQTTYDYHCGGIYVDGAREVNVEGNEVSECDYGIKVSAEKEGLVVKDVVIQDNYIHDNNIGAINVGVWAEKPLTLYNVKVTGNKIMQKDNELYDNQCVILIFRCKNVSIAGNSIECGVNTIGVGKAFTSLEETNLKFDNNKIYNPAIEESGGTFAKYPEEYTYDEFISLVLGKNNKLNRE